MGKVSYDHSPSNQTTASPSSPFIHHFTHPHPLQLLKYQPHLQTLPLPQPSCCRSNPSEWMYACLACNYFLHTHCSQIPQTIVHQSHHHQLNLTLSPPYENKSFSCDICKNVGLNHWLYRCNMCGFDAHLGCANAVIGVQQAPGVQNGGSSSSNGVMKNDHNNDMVANVLKAFEKAKQDNIMALQRLQGPQGIMVGGAGGVGANQLQTLMGGGAGVNPLLSLGGGNPVLQAPAGGGGGGGVNPLLALGGGNPLLQALGGGSGGGGNPVLQAFMGGGGGNPALQALMGGGGGNPALQVLMGGGGGNPALQALMGGGGGNPALQALMGGGGGGNPLQAVMGGGGGGVANVAQSLLGGGGGVANVAQSLLGGGGGGGDLLVGVLGGLVGL